LHNFIVLYSKIIAMLNMVGDFVNKYPSFMNKNAI